jgi:predicted transcriptional regulator
MSNRTDAEIDQALAVTAAEYDEEDRAAAAEEARAAANSRVFSVRLPPDVYEAVREAAERTHLTPSALIRQWVSERVENTGGNDLASTVAALRRDVERLAEFTPPA